MLNFFCTGNLLIQIPRTDIYSIPHEQTSALVEIKFDTAGFRLKIKVFDPFPHDWTYNIFGRHFTTDIHTFITSAIK